MPLLTHSHLDHQLRLVGDPNKAIMQELHCSSDWVSFLKASPTPQHLYIEDEDDLDFKSVNRSLYGRHHSYNGTNKRNNFKECLVYNIRKSNKDKKKNNNKKKNTYKNFCEPHTNEILVETVQERPIFSVSSNIVPQLNFGVSPTIASEQHGGSEPVFRVGKPKRGPHLFGEQGYNRQTRRIAAEQKLIEQEEMELASALEFEESEELRFQSLEQEVEEMSENDSYSLPRPQSPELDEMLGSIGDISQMPECEELGDWVSHLENIVIFGYHLMKAKNMMDITFATMAYIKMNTNKSMVSVVMNMLKELFPPQAEIMPHAWTANETLQQWECLKNNVLFKKVSFLMSAAMSLQVCKTKDITWTPFGMQVVAIEAAKEQLKALDVIDALLTTFSWFATTGYKVFEQKSLKPLLYADGKMQSFNAECDYIMAHADSVLAGNGMNVSDFEHRVDAILITVSNLKSLESKGPTAFWLQQKYSDLIQIKQKIIGKHRNTAIRFQPFGMGLTGPSSVGKSTLAKLVMGMALNAMEFSTEESRIASHDFFDKYDTMITSDILGIFMDDVGNGKSQFCQTSPTDTIIKFFNNMAAQAVKAELNSKGVCFINFKVGILTSNFPDYQVRQYTEKPESILRRFYHTRVRIKPEFRIEGGISLDPMKTDLSAKSATQSELKIQDVWELDIEEVFIYESKTGTDAYRFRPVFAVIDGKALKCVNLDLKTYSKVVIKLAKQHKIVQERVVDRAHKFGKMQYCSQTNLPVPMCNCQVCTPPVVPHAFENLGDAAVKILKQSAVRYFRSWFDPLHTWNSILGFKPIQDMATNQLSKELTQACHNEITPIMISLTPQWVFSTSVFQRSMKYWQVAAAYRDIKQHRKYGILLGLGLAGWSLNSKHGRGVKTVFCLATTWLYSLATWGAYRARIQHYKKEYLSRRDALPVSISCIRDGDAVKGTFVLGSIMVGLKLFHLWYRAKITPNSLTPSDMDNSPGWFGFMMNRMGATVKTSTAAKAATADQVVTTLHKSNLFWAEFVRDDGSMTRCNIFFPRKGVAWFPKHVYYPGANMEGTPCKYLEVTVTRHYEDKPGARFKFKTDMSQSAEIDELDMVACYVPNCVDLKDKTKWLPLSLPQGTGMATIISHNGESMETERISVTFEQVGHTYRDFQGGSYNTKLAKVGVCMAPLVLEQKDPCIVGFHIGGNASKNHGVMQTVTQEMAQNLLSKLENMPGVILSSQGGDIPTEQYGRTVIDKASIHPSSLPARLTSKDYVEVLGSTRLRSKQTSQVKQSMLSEAVEKYCDVPNKWGAAQLQPNWKAFNATLEHIVNPAAMFVPSKLEHSRQDWLKPLWSEMDSYIETEDFRPLTDKEAVLGIPGKRFLDPLRMSTSMGFPVFGQKNKHFTDVLDDSGVLVDRIPSDEIKTEVMRLENAWEAGERGYPICVATLKDEPTLQTSEKVRVFQATAVAMSLLMRKYFLPIARFLSLNPLISESAVGVNAFSKQWEELMDHTTKYATDDKVIAWDYSKYDVRMNSQITRAVYLSFIELAERGGYDSHSLFLMRMMVNDIVHPLLDWNGTLIMAYNLNTSGNNLTVQVNGTAGSLYVRNAFFDLYPDVDFRESVACITYGDDFKGSVKPEYRKFNFETFKSFLAKHDMKVTLPNKSSDTCEFLSDEETDFLKRRSVYISEIQTKIGCLEEDSIFKSLHSNVRSKSATEQQVAVSCIEGAMHEWFAHGRAKYEQRAAQMQEVCKEVNLPVPAVFVTFDERVEHWLSKYSENS